MQPRLSPSLQFLLPAAFLFCSKNSGINNIPASHVDLTSLFLFLYNAEMSVFHPCMFSGDEERQLHVNCGFVYALLVISPLFGPASLASYIYSP